MIPDFSNFYDVDNSRIDLEPISIDNCLGIILSTPDVIRHYNTKGFLVHTTIDEISDKLTAANAFNLTKPIIWINEDTPLYYDYPTLALRSYVMVRPLKIFCPIAFKYNLAKSKFDEVLRNSNNITQLIPIGLLLCPGSTLLENKNQFESTFNQKDTLLSRP